MRVAVLSDIHANYPALQAVLADARAQHCEIVYSTGDVIGIGPYPEECLDLAITTHGFRSVLGNHDFWFVHGLPDPRPSWMGDDELAHQKWVHDRLTGAMRDAVSRWPLVIRAEHEGVTMAVQHFPLDVSGKHFLTGPRPLDVAWLDEKLGNRSTDLVFFGHDHAECDVAGVSRYLNPGSLSLSIAPEARYIIADCNRGTCDIEKRRITYDCESLWDAFEERKVPARELILDNFFRRNV